MVIDDKKIKLFTGQVRINHHTAVDERFQLGAHGVKIYGSCQYDHVGSKHLLNDFRRGIIVDTFAAFAGITGNAVIDRFSGKLNFFNPVSVFLCAADKVVTEDIGVAVLPGRGGYYQNIFHF